jgi:hypothetical protein
MKSWEAIKLCYGGRAVCLPTWRSDTYMRLGRSKPYLMICNDFGLTNRELTLMELSAMGWSEYPPVYKSGEPCAHFGCRSHVSHPCEGCGRTICDGNVYPDQIKF